MTLEQEEKFNRDVDLLQFYAMAQKYGFCTPYCECGKCGKETDK